jgi:RNA polymerase sigma-70 factor (ECF subfamily)
VPAGAGPPTAPTNAFTGRGIVRSVTRAATPIADDLARHAAFMNRLARALARGHDADDLVQDAYVSALCHPPDPDRPARPWLAQVVRNVMRMRVRGEARRREREAAWDEGRAVPTPEELLERAHAHRALAEQVLLLDEPFRRTLLFRYVEGLDTARIAELEGVAPATVRWRIKQGLDRLRERMQDEPRWLRAFAPIAPIAPHRGAPGRAGIKLSDGRSLGGPGLAGLPSLTGGVLVM